MHKIVKRICSKKEKSVERKNVNVINAQISSKYG